MEKTWSIDTQWDQKTVSVLPFPSCSFFYFFADFLIFNLNIVKEAVLWPLVNWEI